MAQPALGTSGRNRNFAPTFTPPGLQALDGYDSDGLNSANPWYRSVDIRRTIPRAKMAAVVAAAATNKVKIQINYGSWPMENGDAKGFRVFVGHPARDIAAGGATDGAAVLTILTAIETAITT